MAVPGIVVQTEIFGNKKIPLEGLVTLKFPKFPGRICSGVVGVLQPLAIMSCPEYLHMKDHTIHYGC